MEYINSFTEFLMSFISTFGIKDAIDILIVSYLLYKCMTFINKTRAQQLVKGIIFLLILMQIANWFKLSTLSFIMKNTMELGLLAVIIVFQPELRGALEHMGRSKIGFSVFHQEQQEQINTIKNMIDSVCDIAEKFSINKTGALIVFERNTKLGDIINTGTIIDSAVSAQLLGNLFYNKSPLHDGAVIMRNGRIHAAACLLPLSSNLNISRDLGTRHRAALGVSEVSDSISLVVSEETGKISLAIDGVLKRNLSIETLKLALPKYLLPEDVDTDKKNNKNGGRKK